MNRRPSTYREQFAGRDRAREYEEVHLAAGSYSDLLWEIEKEQLQGLLGELRRTHQRIDYLDFATGTGRILAHLEPLVNTATGIDVSSEMCEIARRKVAGARLLCKDITAGGDEIEARYDLITAFRFFLNAEPDLRCLALRALAARLKDETSLLVFNNHGNPFSHKLPMWPIHRLRRLGRGYRTEGNSMTDRQARRLADAAGLTIERYLGCGFASPKAMRLVPPEQLLRLERRLAKLGPLRRFGVNRTYVARQR